MEHGPREGRHGLRGGVEPILHSGCLTTLGVLNGPESIAPVVAARSAGDPAAEAPRLSDRPRLEVVPR